MSILKLTKLGKKIQWNSSEFQQIFILKINKSFFHINYMKKDFKESNLFNFKLLKSRRWHLNVYYASANDCPYLAALKQQFQKDEYTIVAVSYETGRMGVNPHWQIYFELIEPRNMNQHMRQVLGEDAGFHLSAAYASTIKSLNYIYAVDKYYELGWIHYAKGHDVPRRYNPDKHKMLVWFRSHMYPWQKEVTNLVTSNKPADNRYIYWIHEPVGNTGKTYLAKYLHYFHGAIVTGGKSADIKYAIARWQQLANSYPVIIIVNLARSKTMTQSGYTTLEEVKDALFFSGKYQSGMVASPYPPHLLVFANKPPDTSMMSQDRWIIKLINSELKLE